MKSRYFRLSSRTSAFRLTFSSCSGFRYYFCDRSSISVSFLLMLRTFFCRARRMGSFSSSTILISGIWFGLLLFCFLDIQTYSKVYETNLVVIEYRYDAESFDKKVLSRYMCFADIKIIFQLLTAISSFFFYDFYEFSRSQIASSYLFDSYYWNGILFTLLSPFFK